MTGKYQPAIFQAIVRPSWAGTLDYLTTEEKAAILEAILSFPVETGINSKFYDKTIRPDLEAQYLKFKTTCELKGRGSKNYWEKISYTYGKDKDNISYPYGKDKDNICYTYDKDMDNILKDKDKDKDKDKGNNKDKDKDKGNGKGRVEDKDEDNSKGKLLSVKDLLTTSEDGAWLNNSDY